MSGLNGSLKKKQRDSVSNAEKNSQSTIKPRKKRDNGNRVYPKHGALYRIAQRIFPIIPVYRGTGSILKLGHTMYYYYDLIEKEGDYPMFLQPYQVQRIYLELQEMGNIKRFQFIKQGKGNLYVRVEE
jgi:hypothetical protein